MAANVNGFIQFMDFYVVADDIAGVVMGDLLLLHNDFVRRTNGDSFLHPNVFNPLVELYCNLHEYKFLHEMKNRTVKLKGISLNQDAQSLVNVLANGVPGTPLYTKRTNELFNRIKSRIENGVQSEAEKNRAEKNRAQQIRPEEPHSEA